MEPLDQLLREVCDLQREVVAAGAAPAKELFARLEAMRQRIDEELLLADTPVAGYLADALVALQLALRALETGDDDRVSDHREQADLYLKAAEQATRHPL